MFSASSLFTITGHTIIGSWNYVVTHLCATQEFLTHVEPEEGCMAQVTKIFYNWFCLCISAIGVFSANLIRRLFSTNCDKRVSHDEW